MSEYNNINAHDLPYTGFDPILLVAFALILIVIGVSFLVARRGN